LGAASHQAKAQAPFGKRSKTKEFMKIFIVINAGSVSAVYADNNKVEVEIIDQDSQDEGERERLLTREDEIAAEFVRVG
jgi:hypothetical protein